MKRQVICPSIIPLKKSASLDRLIVELFNFLVGAQLLGHPVLSFASGQKHRSSLVFASLRIHLGHGPGRLLPSFVAAFTSFRVMSKFSRNRQRKVKNDVWSIFTVLLEFFTDVFVICTPLQQWHRLYTLDILGYEADHFGRLSCVVRIPKLGPSYFDEDRRAREPPLESQPAPIRLSGTQ